MNFFKNGEICFEYPMIWRRAPSLLRVFSPNNDFEIQWRDSSEKVAGLKSELAFFEPLSPLFLPTKLSNVGEPSWRRIPRDHIQDQKEE